MHCKCGLCVEQLPWSPGRSLSFPLPTHFLFWVWRDQGFRYWKIKRRSRKIPLSVPWICWCRNFKTHIYDLMIIQVLWQTNTFPRHSHLALHWGWCVLLRSRDFVLGKVPNSKGNPFWNNQVTFYLFVFFVYLFSLHLGNTIHFPIMPIFWWGFFFLCPVNWG